LRHLADGRVLKYPMRNILEDKRSGNTQGISALNRPSVFYLLKNTLSRMMYPHHRSMS